MTVIIDGVLATGIVSDTQLSPDVQINGVFAIGMASDTQLSPDVQINGVFATSMVGDMRIAMYMRRSMPSINKFGLPSVNAIIINTAPLLQFGRPAVAATIVATPTIWLTTPLPPNFPYIPPILVGPSVHATIVTVIPDVLMLACITLVGPSIKATVFVNEPNINEPNLFAHDIVLPAPIVRAAITANASQVISGHPMMIFNIPQVVNVTYPASLQFQGIMMNNYPVNRTDFRLVRGVHNEVIFFVRDVDRKPVPLPRSDSLTINIVDTATDTLLMSRDMTVVDEGKGIYQFATLPAEMDTWPTGPIRWSIGYNRNTLGTDRPTGTIMLWTDQNYSPYSTLYVTEGPVPGPASTKTLHWSDFQLSDDGYYYSPQLVGAAKDGYVNGMQTFVLHTPSLGLAITGSIRIDGTLAAQPTSGDWFPVFSKNYDAFAGNDPLDVQGNFLWLRIAINLANGSVIEMDYKV